MCKDPQSEESLAHLLQCDYLTRSPQLMKEIKTIQTEDFGAINQQAKAVKVWDKVFKIYKKVQ